MNVILITIDSLRPDFLGCYGNKENLAPNIDSLGKEGIVFQSVISQGPRTAESFPAIMSGIYGSTYLDLYEGLSEKRILISEILKDHGYHTAAFNSNPYISKYRNYNRGFDCFIDNIADIKSVGNHWLRLKLTHLKTLFKDPYTPADEVNKQVFSWLNDKLSPYFLWVHYMDVHGPYIPKSGWSLKNRIKAGLIWKKSTNHPEQLTEKEKAFLSKCYREEVSYADGYVKELLDKIDMDNTVIILMSDHGEFMGERDLYGHPPFYLYDQLLKIPLIIKVPERMGIKNARIRQTVKCLDIVPTILDILNIRHDEEVHGESLLPMMKGDFDSYKCKHFISEVWADHLSVRTENWKLIYRFEDNKKKLELYNIENDKMETINLVNDRKDIVEELEKVILKHKENIKPPFKDRDSSSIETDNEEIRAKLKKLGYM